MNHFPECTTFKYPWRKYQARVLKELEHHLEDNHLHVIAPPGSGKTVLGLEVAIRLNQPTLILAPTIAIRNQWVERLCELFLQTSTTPDWISYNIREPKFITVSTYQGLHAACCGNSDDESEEGKSRSSEIEKLADSLTAIGIKTVVVDEAHHLKKAWWESLTTIKEKLEPTTVGLTATPPYDVSALEWNRYTELNGPVDAEIAVPELVREGDLCPHQDYIMFSTPTDVELKEIEEIQQAFDSLFNELVSDAELVEALVRHPLFTNPEEYTSWILDHFDEYLSLLVFLNGKEEILPEHLAVAEGLNLIIPENSKEWLQELLTFLIFKAEESMKLETELEKRIKSTLRKASALKRKTVVLADEERIDSVLNSSVAKLQSIDDIVDFEHNSLGSELRMVILTDYIRKEYLATGETNDLELEKIGVVPIFEQLRRSNDRSMKIGVLSGSLVIIPAESLAELQSIAHEIVGSELSTEPLSYDSNFLIVHCSSSQRNMQVAIITELFKRGGIEILIGTKSLLGEGWDAPCINSLVLASFVGSFVQSNQMRGRAIRSERNNPEKTGNIWHLVAIDPSKSSGGSDLELQRRRFRAFMGLSFVDDSITNGFERLSVASKISIPNVDAINARMCSHAEKREDLRDQWRRSVVKGSVMKEQLKRPFNAVHESYEKIVAALKAKSLNYLIQFLASSFGAFVVYGMQQGAGLYLRFKPGINPKLYMISLFFLLLIGWIITSGTLLFRTVTLSMKYRDIGSDMRNIATALLNTLCETGNITTPRSELGISSGNDEDGTVFCNLEGGTTYDKSLFLGALEEIVSPIRSPRYLIIRKSTFLNMMPQQDFHAVPEIVAKNKKSAVLFAEQWKRCVGDCDLVYSKSDEGKKLRIKARVLSLASQLEDPCERVERWVEENDTDSN